MKSKGADKKQEGSASKEQISRREAIRRMAKATAMAGLGVSMALGGEARASNSYYGSYCSSYSSLNSYGSYAHSSNYFSSNYYVCNYYYGSYWSYG